MNASADGLTYTSAPYSYTEHSFAIKGEISDDTFPGFFIMESPHDDKYIEAVYYTTESGSCDVRIRVDGAGVGSNISVTSATGAVSMGSIAVNSSNYIDIDVTHTSSCNDLVVTVIINNKLIL